MPLAFPQLLWEQTFLQSLRERYTLTNLALITHDGRFWHQDTVSNIFKVQRSCINQHALHATKLYKVQNADQLVPYVI